MVSVPACTLYGPYMQPICKGVAMCKGRIDK